MVLYAPFCLADAVESISNYFCQAIRFFVAGVLTYYGKREQNQVKHLFYMLFIAVFGMRYSVLNLNEAGLVCLLIVILLCFPFKIQERGSISDALK